MSATKRVGLAVVATAAVGLLALGGIYAYGRYDRGRTLILATTTSTEDSGLLDVLLPPFEEENHAKVKVIAVGTGQALELGKKGDADVLMVHAPASEKVFMDEGHGLSRTPLMYNDFILVGPASDPAGAAKAADVEGAFRAIAAAGAEGKALFLSRGDDSGTDKKDKALWSRYNIDTNASWYQEIGAGMGETLKMAADRGAYTLSDRATYLALYGPGSEGDGKLSVVYQGGSDLHNPYSVIIVDPASHPNVNVKLAREFVDYLASDEARTIIGTFGADKYGQPLFWLLDSSGP